MLYVLYRMGFSLAKILPLRTGYAIAEIIARAYFIFAKKDREALKENLRVILGEEASEMVLDEHVMEVFRNFAKYLVDFFRFPKFTEKYISRNIDIEGREHLDGCLSEGKGMIALSLHLGNWELGGAVVAGLEYPISAIVLEHKSKKIDDFFVRQRAINGMRSIPIGMQIKECFRALGRNEVIAIAGDKDYTSNGILVDFFGKKAVMPKGPAVIALRTGAPIVFCALIRKKNDTFKLCIEPPIKYEALGDPEKDLRTLMGKYLDIFEKHIRENPDQWYAFRKIWNQEQIIQ